MYKINAITETDTGWIFEVLTEAGRHRVTLDDNYYRRLAGGEIAPEVLVEESFEFLLEHEPAESILEEFNLTRIGDYFPDYEEEMGKRLK